MAQVPDGDSYGAVYSRYDGPVVHYRQVLLVSCRLADGVCRVAVDDLDAEPSSQSPVLFGL